MSIIKSKHSISTRPSKPLLLNEISAMLTVETRISIAKPKPKPPPPKPLPQKPLAPPKEPEEIPQRVFLYLKTLKVDNLPELVDDHDVVLRMQHGDNAITKVEDHYTGKTDANLSSGQEELPIYSIRINQDNVEDLNSICDTPLKITIYEYIPKGRKASKSVFTFDSLDSLKVEGAKLESDDELGDEITEEDIWLPIAQGNLDLLQFFSQNKTAGIDSVFLYPMTITKMPIAIPTCKVTMQVTAVLPLLKNVSFCNMAFITFESIYNATPEIMDADPLDLTVDLSFQSKTNANDKVNICNFSMFSKSIISQQNIKHKWESMKDTNVNATSLGVYSGLSLSLHKLFIALLGTNGVDFKFNEILQDEEYALVCNSVHRFALTKELVAILEDAIAFNEQHILVELYQESNPDKILLEGICDLSIFLYPQVNACRFAVELKSPKRKSKTNVAPSKGTPSKKSPLKVDKVRTSTRQSTQPDKTTFAILNICLLTPITDVQELISKFNEDANKKGALQTCQPIKSETKISSLDMRKELYYQEIDEMVHKLIAYIISKNVKHTLDAKEYFCCQLGNLVNKIIKLIASDFNIRTPTKTNIEFVNLITTVYKELEQRWYNILQSCDDSKLNECFCELEEKQLKIIEAMNMAKLTSEAGKEELGRFILEKIKKKYAEHTELNFYIFIYDMEKLDYEAAKTYLSKPLKERLADDEYHSEIMKVYIEYMEKLQQEETAENALEELLKTVKEFIDKYPKEIDFWILLYCLYSNSGYLPGMEYTRWKYENLNQFTQKELPPLPKSRWSINNNYKLTVTSKKGIKFYGVMKTFLKLGLYKFAEIVFNQLSTEISELERHFMTTTFSIFQNASRIFVKGKERTKDADDIKAYQALIIGNLEYYKGNTATAMDNYHKLLNLKLPLAYEDFQLGLLRLGFYMLEIEQKYLTARKAFEKCRLNDESCMIVDFGLGKTIYKLGHLEDALTNFARATTYSMHIPDIWGYLALINLKLGENFKALECWKYAKLDPKNIISDEILEELNAINPSDVMLYVDIPEEHLSSKIDVK